MQTNAFSDTWYDTFLYSIPEKRTEAELQFVRRNLPVGDFPRILDICCGPARHATSLTQEGYLIHGIDAGENAVRQARRKCPQGRFDVLDMRNLSTLKGPFDAAINLWHSFGYFDDKTNLRVLRSLSGLLRTGGKAIFDLYNDQYLEHTAAIRETERAGRTVRTHKRRNGSRLQVSLKYDDLEGDSFDWRLYTPDEFQELCENAGFATLVRCTRFDETSTIGPGDSRMQFVLARS
jgi:SAM-dependent methyltransferase